MYRADWLTGKRAKDAPSQGGQAQPADEQIAAQARGHAITTLTWLIANGKKVTNSQVEDYLAAAFTQVMMEARDQAASVPLVGRPEGGNEPEEVGGEVRPTTNVTPQLSIPLLRPMSSAPRDGSEIEVTLKSGRRHFVSWRNEAWRGNLSFSDYVCYGWQVKPELTDE